MCNKKRERAEFSYRSISFWKPNYTYVVKYTKRCNILEISISRKKVKIIACTIVILS